SGPFWRKTEAAAAILAFDPEDVEKALPAMFTALKDPLLNRMLNVPIIRAMGRIRKTPAQSQEFIAALTGALDSRNPFMRSESASTLGGLGQKAREGVPRLRALAESDPAPFVRLAAAEA